MVVGSGQIAKAFSAYTDDSRIVIFASGVSDSNEIRRSEFDREKGLLMQHLKYSCGKKFVYFSSCALIDEANYLPYYKHKFEMEALVKKNSENSYIFRLPQLFGELKRHPTLINYLYYKIVDGEEFIVNDKAYRYVIHVEDVVFIVSNYLTKAKKNTVLDVANPYAYSIKEIVECLEIKAGRKALFTTISKSDAYNLDLAPLMTFLIEKNMDYKFGEGYLRNHLAIL
jgi:UDP-2-acetamido-2,6-beta-L-arabino-hexul-4-ose reductase